MPFHNSFTAICNPGGGLYPPESNAALVVPQPLTDARAVFISAISVQEVPFQFSTIATFAVAKPAAQKPAVAVPRLPKACLPTFKSFTSVQDDPL